MEVDTSWPVGVRGRGMSEECLLPSLPARVRPWAYRNKGHPTATETTTAVIGEPRTEAHIRQYECTHMCRYVRIAAGQVSIGLSRVASDS